MMNMTFATLYLVSALSLFGLAILTGYLFEHGRSAWRRWRCKQEMEKQERIRRDCVLCQTVVSPHPHHAIDWASPQDETLIVHSGTGYRFSRRDLENLATARDKAERKIH